MSFSATLPVKPSATTTSATPSMTTLPSVLPTKSTSGEDTARSCRSLWASWTSGVPIASVPLDSSARGRWMPRTVEASAAPMKANCREVLGTDLGVGADVEQRDRLAAARNGQRDRQRRPVDALGALDVPAARRQAQRRRWSRRRRARQRGLRRRPWRPGRSRRLALIATRRRGPGRCSRSRRERRRPRRGRRAHRSHRTSPLGRRAVCERPRARRSRRRRRLRRGRGRRHWRRPRQRCGSRPLPGAIGLVLVAVVIGVGLEDLTAGVEVPHTGQTRCGRRGLWHCGHALIAGELILCLRATLGRARLYGCFCFGTAMGDAEG